MLTLLIDGLGHETCIYSSFSISKFSKIDFIFQARILLKPLVTLMSRFVAHSARISIDRHTQTDTHTQTKYRNPRCACADSYRPITVTSTLSKVLELVLLQRMELTLREAGIPHLNQTAYRKNASCVDGIFSTQEAILRYINDGSTVYMCMFDLQKPMTVLSFQCYLTASTTLG